MKQVRMKVLNCFDKKCLEVLKIVQRLVRWILFILLKRLKVLDFDKCKNLNVEFSTNNNHFVKN